jgi:hypothetical protein
MDPFAEAAARAAGKRQGAQGSALVNRDPELSVVHRDPESQLPVVVDPLTGEVFDQPTELPTDRLAELAYRLRRADQERRIWRNAVENELRERLKRERPKRREAVVGTYRLKLPAGREWDADELEGAVRDLEASDVLSAGEWADLWGKPVRKVNGRRAEQLLNHLTGAAHDVIANCFKWKDKTLEIDPMPEQLGPGGGDADR